MKTILKTRYITMMMLVGLLAWTGCSEDDGETVEGVAPTISIVSPEDAINGILTKEGETVSITFAIGAEAGLSSLTVDGQSIKVYTGTELSDEVTYDYLALEQGSIDLEVIVEDVLAKTTTIIIPVTIEEGINLGYLIIDFAGESTANEEKTISDWDVRQLTTFGVSGSHSTSATAEAVNSQAQFLFAQDNPDTEDDSKAFMFDKTIPEGYDNWGGWAHIMFNLGSVLPEADVRALPTWDNENVATVPGTKVIQVEAYYDDTIDAEFDWTALTALTDIWNADPTQGYKLDLQLAAYDPMGITDGGHDGGFYMGYEGYISEPNKWVTVTFSMADAGRTGSFFGNAEIAPDADAIDCIKIIPAGGYTATDANAVYFKNLRIVDVE
ncbi:MAG: hypothetical protein OCD76_04675 [Reichenbachiella sp.]